MGHSHAGHTHGGGTAGGRHKVRAIAAVLRGGYSSVLVSDEATARAAAALAKKGSRR